MFKFVKMLAELPAGQSMSSLMLTAMFLQFTHLLLKYEWFEQQNQHNLDRLITRFSLKILS